MRTTSFEVDHEKWSPIGPDTNMDVVRETICDRKWWHF